MPECNWDALEIEAVGPVKPKATAKDPVVALVFQIKNNGGRGTQGVTS
jgi:hypothetical protein